MLEVIFRDFISRQTPGTPAGKKPAPEGAGVKLSFVDILGPPQNENVLESVHVSGEAMRQIAVTPFGFA
jgi:hypothetical protein